MTAAQIIAISSVSNRCIYFSTNGAGYKLYDKVVCQALDQLCSNQEEADTNVFLAAKIADVGCTGAVIVTVDSDIGILACYYANKLEIHGTDWYW